MGFGQLCLSCNQCCHSPAARSCSYHDFTQPIAWQQEAHRLTGNLGSYSERRKEGIKKKGENTNN